MGEWEDCVECNGTGVKKDKRWPSLCDWCDSTGRVEIDDDTPMEPTEGEKMEPVTEYLVLVVYTQGTTAFRNVTAWSVGDGFMHLSNSERDWSAFVPMANVKSVEIDPMEGQPGT